MKVIAYNTQQYHTFHLVTPSPWPLLASFGALMTTVGGVMYMHFYKHGGFLLTLGFVFLLSAMAAWWRDVVRESTWEGMHTDAVMNGLAWGVVLFIISEVMFFVSFFWAFLHSSISASIEMGCVWPPNYIPVHYKVVIPYVNTWILLLSSQLVSEAHVELVDEHEYKAVQAMLFFTILMGIVFLYFQFYEYYYNGVNINTDVFGSAFYMITGFHGFHVIVGVCFLIVCFFRFSFKHFSYAHHVGFIAAAWYWHFVDVVWLFVYTIIYGAGIVGLHL